MLCPLFQQQDIALVVGVVLQSLTRALGVLVVIHLTVAVAMDQGLSLLARIPPLVVDGVVLSRIKLLGSLPEWLI